MMHGTERFVKLYLWRDRKKVVHLSEKHPARLTLCGQEILEMAYAGQHGISTVTATCLNCATK